MKYESSFFCHERILIYYFFFHFISCIPHKRKTKTKNWDYLENLKKCSIGHKGKKSKQNKKGKNYKIKKKIRNRNPKRNKKLRI